MFTLTEDAARQVQLAASDSGAQELALRIAAQPDADGGVQYGMGFDDPKEDDLMLDLYGVAVVIGIESQRLLQHIVLDWVELEPGTFNFIFIDSRRMQGTAQADGGACATACGSGGCGPRGCSGAGGTQ